MTDQQTHTREWEANGNAVHERVSPHYGTCIATAHGDSHPEAVGRAKFIRDCCASYRKHFGPSAVTAAEGDYLGRAIKLLQDARDEVARVAVEHESPTIQMVARIKVEDIDAFLAPLPTAASKEQ